jgi:hypothetical protein
LSQIRNVMTIIDISLKVNVIIYSEKFSKYERNES